MTDVISHNRLIVNSGGGVWPFLWAPYIQIEKLKELFDRHQVRYYVEDYTLSHNDGPEMIKVTFDRDANADSIQNILDTAQ